MCMQLAERTFWSISASMPPAPDSLTPRAARPLQGRGYWVPAGPSSPPIEKPEPDCYTATLKSGSQPRHVGGVQEGGVVGQITD